MYRVPQSAKILLDKYSGKTRVWGEIFSICRSAQTIQLVHSFPAKNTTTAKDFINLTKKIHRRTVNSGPRRYI